MGLLTLSCLLLAIGHTSAKLTAVPNCGRSLAATGRIVNGTVTRPGAYPWMVSIQQRMKSGKFGQICGGTVLNENWIVTAAHCFDQPIVVKDYEVFVGIYSITKKNDSTVQNLKLSSIKIHENYTTEGYGYDIALLKTATKINITGSGGYVNAICLPSASSTPTGDATVTGWGLLKDNGSMSAQLREASVPIVPRKDCKAKYEDEDSDFVYIEVVDHMLCAGGKGKDSCQGDSGGPLFQTNKKGVATLIGTVASGADCAYKDYPGLYMKVSSFLDWMDKRTT